MSKLNRNSRLGVVFTDLDGTLLDRDTYRWTAARPALDALRQRGIPLVFVTSKTAAEVWPLMRTLGRRDPFVVENGGAIVFRPRYFPFAILPGGRPLPGGWQQVTLGAPRRRLITALRLAARRAGVRVRGFSQMSPREVAELTGLTLVESRRALQRQCDEPFALLDPHPPVAWRRLGREIRRLGFSPTRGTRLFHITGSDKGTAIQQLTRWFRRAATSSNAKRFGGGTGAGARAGGFGLTVGLGDSSNDVPLLRAVDLPIIVAGANGRYDAETLAAVPQARRAGGTGPAGWNRSILELLSA